MKLCCCNKKQKTNNSQPGKWCRGRNKQCIPKVQMTTSDISETNENDDSGHDWRYLHDPCRCAAAETAKKATASLLLRCLTLERDITSGVCWFECGCGAVHAAHLWRCRSELKETDVTRMVIKEGHTDKSQRCWRLAHIATSPRVVEEEGDQYETTPSDKHESHSCSPPYDRLLPHPLPALHQRAPPLLLLLNLLPPPSCFFINGTQHF